MFVTEFCETVRQLRIAMNDVTRDKSNMPARIKVREMGEIIDRALSEGVTFLTEAEPTPEEQEALLIRFAALNRVPVDMSAPDLDA